MQIVLCAQESKSKQQIFIIMQKLDEKFLMFHNSRQYDIIFIKFSLKWFPQVFYNVGST